MNNKEEQKGIHINYTVITEIIDEKSKVLDLGCGNGELLKKLITEKKVTGTGIEIDQNYAIEAISKGLSIIRGDIDEGLKQFNDKEYDWVVLNQTLQSTQKPEFVIDEMLRISKKVIVSFPNFGYWKVRFYLFFKGKMPKSKTLPFEWYDTPNIHLLTIDDFFEYCKKRDIKITQKIYLKQGKIRRNPLFKFNANFFTDEAIFVIEK